MEFQEYMKIKQRIVKTNSQKKCNIGCWLCPLSDHKNGMGIGCRELEWRYPEKAEEIVKQWAKEYPQKTCAQDFFEKYPKAEKDKYGNPKPCRKDIYGGCCSDYDSCTECWNEPMEGEL